ncbi:hypothetical protein SK128_018819 [Halocaridina rubra]|uniref:Uncharacterized protein n=1 Tax=Halocaridina rubra TaxID=373956 RepID=A0AAN8X1H9_HALRR
MHLPLYISCDTLNKNKRPWSNLCWLGEDTSTVYSIKEGLVHRINVQSGSAYSISKLNKVAKNAAAISHTYRGTYVYGILKCGDLFFWNQKTNVLTHAKGIPELGTNQLHSGINAREGPFHGVLDLFKLPQQEGRESPDTDSTVQNEAASSVIPQLQRTRIFGSEDCNRVILITGSSQVYLWEKNTGESSALPQDIIDGTWSVIVDPRESAVLTQHSHDLEISFCFCNEAPLGDQCLITFSFANAMSLINTTLILCWGGMKKSSCASTSATARWHTISTSLTAIGMKGTNLGSQSVALVAQYAHRKPFLCIAVNSSEKYCSKLVYMHPLRDTNMVVNIENVESGSRIYSTMSQSEVPCQVVDLAWSHNNTYLYGCLNSGTIFVATRMGPLVKISCSGENVNSQASSLLALHPHSTLNRNVLGNENNKEAKYIAPRRQFFIASHPYKNKFLLSSDHRVTVLSLPENCSNDAEVVDQLLQTAKHALYLLHHSSVTHDYAYIRSSTWKLAQSVQDLYQGFENVDKAKRCEINLWQKEEPRLLQEKVHISSSEEEELMQNFLDPLLAAWTMVVARSGPSTKEWQGRIRAVREMLENLISVLIHTTVDDDRVVHEAQMASGISSKPYIVKTIIVLTHNVIHILLKCEKHNKEKNKIDTILILVQTLIHVERVLGSLFAYQPVSESDHGLPHEAVMEAPSCSVTDTRMLSALSNLRSYNPVTDKKLKALWICLYKNARELYIKLQNDRFDQTNYQKCLTVIYLLQRRLQKLDFHVYICKHKVERGNDLYIKGKVYNAIEMWKLEAVNASIYFKHRKFASKRLHSVLYAYLSLSDFSGLSSFVAWLYNKVLDIITEYQSGSRQSHRVPELEVGKGLDIITKYQSGSSHSTNNVPELEVMNVALQQAVENSLYFLNGESDIKRNKQTKDLKCDLVSNTTTVNKADDKIASQDPEASQRKFALRFISSVLQVIGSLGLFMARAFIGMNIDLPLPHKPHLFQPLEQGLDSRERERVLTRSAAFKKACLEGCWTPQMAVQALSFAGYWSDLAVFAMEMGNVKLALISSIAAVGAVPQRVPNRWSFQPATLLKKAIYSTWTTRQLDSVTFHSIQELLKVASLMLLEIIPEILQECLQNIKEIFQGLKFIIPIDVYLPAPPVFCPQFASLDSEKVNELERADESVSREQLGTWVRLFTVVVNAAGLSRHVLSQYCEEYGQHSDELDVGQYYQELKSLFESLPSKHKYSPTGPEWSKVSRLWRELLTHLWIFHSRDKLCLSLRKISRLSSFHIKKEKEQTSLYEEILTWALELNEATSIAHWRDEITCIGHWKDEIISLGIVAASNASLSIETVERFGRLIPDASSLPSLLKDKTARLLDSWKNTNLIAEVPKTILVEIEVIGEKRVNMYELYKKVCDAVRSEDELKNGINENDDLLCREELLPYTHCFKTVTEFHKMVSLFASMTFGKDVESFPQYLIHIPLLQQFSQAVRKQEFKGLVLKNQIWDCSGTEKGISKPFYIADDSKHVKLQGNSKEDCVEKKGLFRSLSFSKIWQSNTKVKLCIEQPWKRDFRSPGKRLRKNCCKVQAPSASSRKSKKSSKRGYQISERSTNSSQVQNSSVSSRKRKKSSKKSERMFRRSSNSQGTKKYSDRDYELSFTKMKINERASAHLSHQEYPLKELINLSRVWNANYDEYRLDIYLILWLLQSERGILSCPLKSTTNKEVTTDILLVPEDIIGALKWNLYKRKLFGKDPSNNRDFSVQKDIAVDTSVSAPLETSAFVLSDIIVNKKLGKLKLMKKRSSKAKAKAYLRPGSETRKEDLTCDRSLIPEENNYAKRKEIASAANEDSNLHSEVTHNATKPKVVEHTSNNLENNKLGDTNDFDPISHGKHVEEDVSEARATHRPKCDNNAAMLPLLPTSETPLVQKDNVKQHLIQEKNPQNIQSQGILTDSGVSTLAKGNVTQYLSQEGNPQVLQGVSILSDSGPKLEENPHVLQSTKIFTNTDSECAVNKDLLNLCKLQQDGLRAVVDAVQVLQQTYSGKHEEAEQTLFDKNQKAQQTFSDKNQKAQQTFPDKNQKAQQTFPDKSQKAQQTFPVKCQKAQLTFPDENRRANINDNQKAKINYCHQVEIETLETRKNSSKKVEYIERKLARNYKQVPFKFEGDDECVSSSENSLKCAVQASEAVNLWKPFKLNANLKSKPPKLVLEVTDKINHESRPGQDGPLSAIKKKSLTPVETPSEAIEPGLYMGHKVTNSPKEEIEDGKKLSISDLQLDEEDWRNPHISYEDDLPHMHNAYPDDTLDDITLPQSLHVSDLDEEESMLNSSNQNLIAKKLLKNSKERAAQPDIEIGRNMTLTPGQTQGRHSLPKQYRWDKDLNLKLLALTTKPSTKVIIKERVSKPKTIEKELVKGIPMKLLSLSKTQVHHSQIKVEEQKPLILKKLPHHILQSSSTYKNSIAFPSLVNSSLRNEEKDMQGKYSSKFSCLPSFQNIRTLKLPTSVQKPQTDSVNERELKFMHPAEIFSYYNRQLKMKKGNKYKTLKLSSLEREKAMIYHTDKPSTDDALKNVRSNANEEKRKNIKDSAFSTNPLITGNMDILRPTSASDTNIDKRAFEEVRNYSEQQAANVYNSVLDRKPCIEVKENSKLFAIETDKTIKHRAHHTLYSKGTQTINRQQSFVRENAAEAFVAICTKDDIGRLESSSRPQTAERSDTYINSFNKNCKNLLTKAVETFIPSKESWTQASTVLPLQNRADVQTQTLPQATVDATISTEINNAISVPLSLQHVSLSIADETFDPQPQPLVHSITEALLTQVVDIPKHIVEKRLATISDELNNTVSLSPFKEEDIHTQPAFEASAELVMESEGRISDIAKEDRHAFEIKKLNSVLATEHEILNKNYLDSSVIDGTKGLYEEPDNKSMESQSVIAKIETHVFDIERQELPSVSNHKNLDNNCVGSSVFNGSEHSYEKVKKRNQKIVTQEDSSGISDINNKDLETFNDLQRDEVCLTLNDLIQGFSSGNLTFEDVCRLSSNIEVENLASKDGEPQDKSVVDINDLEEIENEMSEAALGLQSSREMLSKLDVYFEELSSTSIQKSIKQNKGKSFSSRRNSLSLKKMKYEWQRVQSLYQKTGNSEGLLNFLDSLGPDDINFEIIEGVMDCVARENKDKTHIQPCNSCPNSHIPAFNSCPTSHSPAFASHPNSHIAALNSRPNSHISALDSRPSPLSLACNLHPNSRIPALDSCPNPLSVQSSHRNKVKEYVYSEEKNESVIKDSTYILKELEDTLQELPQDIEMSSPDLHLDLIGLRSVSTSTLHASTHSLSQLSQGEMETDEEKKQRKREVKQWMKEQRRKRIMKTSSNQSLTPNLLTAKEKNNSQPSVTGKQIRDWLQERQEKRRQLNYTLQRKLENDASKICQDFDEELSSHRSLLHTEHPSLSLKPFRLSSMKSCKRSPTLSRKQHASVKEGTIRQPNMPNNKSRYSGTFQPELRSGMNRFINDKEVTSRTDDLDSITLSVSSTPRSDQREKTYQMKETLKDDLSSEVNSLLEVLKSSRNAKHDVPGMSSKNNDSSESSSQPKPKHVLNRLVQQYALPSNRYVQLRDKTSNSQLEKISEVDSNTSLSSCLENNSEHENLIEARSSTDSNSDCSWNVPVAVQKLLYHQ